MKATPSALWSCCWNTGSPCEQTFQPGIPASAAAGDTPVHCPFPVCRLPSASLLLMGRKQRGWKTGGEAVRARGVRMGPWEHVRVFHVMASLHPHPGRHDDSSGCCQQPLSCATSVLSKTKHSTRGTRQQRGQCQPNRGPDANKYSCVQRVEKRL